MSVEEEVAFMRNKANETETYTLRCFMCKCKPFYVENDKALVPGHVYSQSGMDEFGISGLCEYCFDKAFSEDDEDEV